MVNAPGFPACSWCEEVSALVDGQAQEPAAVRQHLAVCETCFEFHAFLVRLGSELTKHNAQVDSVAPTWERLRPSLPSPSRMPHPSWWTWPSLELAPAVALALVLALVATQTPRLIPAPPSLTWKIQDVTHLI